MSRTIPKMSKIRSRWPGTTVKEKNKEKPEPAWIEPEYIHGNPALMSGGGVVNCPEYDQRYKGQREICAQMDGGRRQRTDLDATEIKEDRKKRKKEEEERLNFYSTPLYLEV
jgi:hypothetical protein